MEPPAPLDTEVVDRCDLCRSADSTALVATHDRLHRLPGSFQLVRCDDCGLVRLSPRPTAQSLPRYYPEGEYHAHQRTVLTQGSPDRSLAWVRDALRDEALRTLGYPRASHSWARPILRAARRPLVRRATFGCPGFPPYVEGGTALDVGCGNGAFLAVLQQAGWRVVGVDLSLAAAEASADSFGIEVHTGEVTDPYFDGRQFDFVHMSHVLEHVSSPTTTLRRVAALLRPGGMLYVETPNIDAMGFRIWRSRWFPLESPRHLWLFSGPTLTRTLTGAGLTVDRLTTSMWSTGAWEETYREEERTGVALDPRPQVRPTARPRVAALVGLLKLWRAVKPSSGDFLSCWARKPDTEAAPLRT